MCSDYNRVNLDIGNTKTSKKYQMFENQTIHF